MRSAAIGIHPVEDHVVGHQVDEHLRPDGDRVVAAVLVLGDAGDAVQALGAVDGEALDVLAELGAVADEVLRGVAVGELRQHLGELGVDRGAVVALHEVLDDELPVRLHVVDDPPADAQLVDVVVRRSTRRRRAARRPRRITSSSKDGGSSARQTQT